MFSEDKEKQLRQQKDGKFDPPFNEKSGSAYIFGKTAGVSEAVIRYIFAINQVQFDRSVLKTTTVWEFTDKI